MTHKQEEINPNKALLNLILSDAIKREASDIYLEKYNNLYRVRYRSNGELHEMMRPPLKLYHSVSNELKLLFGLLEKKEKPLTWQEEWKNRILGMNNNPKIEWLPKPNPHPYTTTKMEEQEVNLYLTILPSWNENYHIQLFNQKYLDKTIDLEVKELCNTTKSGLVIISSPPGEGKTTTAYQLLKHLITADQERNGLQKIIALEQKRTYHLTEIDQIIANPQQPSYNETLTSIRNQQPNIIFFDDLEDQITTTQALRYAQNNVLVLAAMTAQNPSTCLKYLQQLGATTAEIKAIIPSRINQKT